MKRDELYIYGDGETATYSKSEADSVMGEYEQRIKELEEEVIGYKASLERANFKMREKDARIKELEGIKHADIVRIAELEAENARLKAQVPKWHSVADGDLPKNGQYVIAKNDHIFVDIEKTLKEVCVFYEKSCDLKTFEEVKNVFHTSFLKYDEVTHWMPLPTTEETSATEKNEAVIKQNLTTEKENG